MKSGQHRSVRRLAGAAMVLAIGLVGAALGPAPAAQAVIDPGSIAGTVTDLADHALAGVTVSVLEYNGSFMVVKGQDETDATGAYQVDDVAASSMGYLVRFTGAGLATEYYDDNVSDTFATRVPVTAYRTTSGVDAAMGPGATISGRVTTPTGTPMVGVQVQLWWNPPAYVIPMDTYLTDQDGRYTIAGVKAARYYLGFYDPVSGIREFWNDQPAGFGVGGYFPSPSATALDVTAGGSMPGLDAVLGTPVVQTRAVTNLVRPRVRGTLRVGKVVRASRGEWAPSTVTLYYQWYAGSKAVAHGTHRRLAVTRKLVGKRLKVLVTAEAPGYLVGWSWTRPTARVRR